MARRIGVEFIATVDEWLDDGRLVIQPGEDCREFPAIGERVVIHRNVGPEAPDSEPEAPGLP